MKAHEQTDKILAKANRTTKQTYLNSFREIKDQFLLEYSKIQLNPEMSAQAKLNEANKYDRFNKITEIVVEKLVNTNRNAISEINNKLNDIYRLNYNEVADSLKKDGLDVDEINKTETKEEIKENADPYNKIAINTATDRANIRRSVSNVLLASILGAISGYNAFKGLQNVFESNLNSSVRITTTQATNMENMAITNVLLNAEKQAEKQDKVIIKVWNSIGDDRTRTAHARANGQEAEIDKPFYVGGEQLLFPADINASASNRINCRCYISYKVVKK